MTDKNQVGEKAEKSYTKWAEQCGTDRSSFCALWHWGTSLSGLCFLTVWQYFRQDISISGREEKLAFQFLSLVHHRKPYSSCPALSHNPQPTPDSYAEASHVFLRAFNISFPGPQLLDHLDPIWKLGLGHSSFAVKALFHQLPRALVEMFFGFSVGLMEALAYWLPNKGLLSFVLSPGLPVKVRVASCLSAIPHSILPRSQRWS